MSENKKDNLPIRGPGIWYVIHSLSIDIENDYELDNFREYFINIINNLPCPECKKHANEYYDKNPIKYALLGKYVGGNYYYDFPVGVFEWTWSFHNFVNFHIGKDMLEFDTALSLYVVHNLNYENSGAEKLEDEDSCDSCSL